MHIDEIGDYGLNYVRSKARWLIEKRGLPWSEFENLQQAMLLDLVQRLPNYAPAISPRNAFITLIVDNKAFELGTQWFSPSQEHFRSESSINLPLEDAGRQKELGETLCDAQMLGESADLAFDLEAAIMGLPEDLRGLWDMLLLHPTIAEISRITCIPETTLKDRRKKLLRRLARAGIDAYFEE